MFATWGTTVTRRRRAILALAVMFAVFAGVWGTGVFSRLGGDSSLDDPASESQVMAGRVEAELGRQSVDFVALYSSSTLTVDDPAFRSAVRSATGRTAGAEGVAQVLSYYDTGAPALVSLDRHATYVPVRLVAGSSSSVVKRVRAGLAAEGLITQVGGSKAVDLAIDGRVGPDIARAEMISMPLLFVLLVLVFGNVVAACMPLLVGGLAVLGAFTVVRVLTMFTEMSIFSINIITILGLGLAVDYGLFMVSRFREELDDGTPVPQAVSRTMATAGRTVAVSGLVVGLSLSSLLLFPQVLLRSMGLGGAAAVLVAMVSSLTVLPAALAALGPRIDAGRLPWKRRPRRRSGGAGAWGRLAAGVMRRPVLVVTGVSVLLLVLAAPFLGVHFGGIDERMLPAGTESRVVSERLAADFADAGARPVRVLVSGGTASGATAYAAQVRQVTGVRDVTVAAQRGTSTLLTVGYAGEASSPSAQRIVKDIRALPRPNGTEVLVGGSSAGVVDQLHSLASRLPAMALLVAGITFVLLSLAFGSVVVPLKAIAMNLVSLGAAFGVVVWVFQSGHLSGVLGFTPTGYIEASQPVLMVAILFGLSMDYEVFLLSRIREHWDRTGDSTESVARGLQSTGGIITTAALLLCVVVGSFSTSGITFLKMVGVGMFVALVVDATLVRLLLVPATMRLLGRHNWWAPPFLTRLYATYAAAPDALAVAAPHVPAARSERPATAPQPTVR